MPQNLKITKYSKNPANDQKQYTVIRLTLPIATLKRAPKQYTVIRLKPKTKQGPCNRSSYMVHPAYSYTQASPTAVVSHQL